jgi:hypothetical protein
VTRYRIVPERSRVFIDARSNVHPIHSSTDGLEGHFDFELGLGGALDPSFPPAGTLSLAVERLSSGNRMEDRELYRRIDARRYPSIAGVLQEMTPSADDDCYQVRGDVTFRGVTRPHTDQVTVRAIDERTIELQGMSRFDIREFGMEAPRVLMLKVEPEVDVRVEIIAEKES